MQKVVLVFVMCCSSVFGSSSELLKKIAESKGDDKIRALENYVNEIRHDSSERVLPFALEGVKLSSKNPGSKLHYNALVNLSSVYLDLGKVDSSLAVAQRGYSIAEKKKDDLGRAYFLCSFGTIERLKGNYKKAIENYLETIRLSENSGEKGFVGYVYNALGITYYDIKDFKKSLEYLREGMTKNNDDENKLIEYYLNIGSAFSELGQQDSAIYFWNKCKDLAEAQNYHDMLSAVYNNLAGSYYRLGQTDKTLELGLKSLHLAEKYNDKHSILLYCINLGELYGELGQFDKSFEFINRALTNARSLNYKKHIAAAYIALSNVYEMKGDLRNALVYHKQYLAARDSLFNEESSKQVSELNAKYETEKKQQRIEMLSKETALQRSEVDRQKVLRNSMIGVSLLIAGFGFIVFRGYREKKKANVQLTEQRDQIEFQRGMLEHKNKDITDSITYGKRIQTALLPKITIWPKEDHFLVFKSRDIVSGDFYWAGEDGSKKIFVVADCTGHGVPGAFMSMIGISLLNDLVKVRQKTDPAEMLNALRAGVIESLNTDGDDMKDGMDISVAVIDTRSMTLNFAGANNSGYLCRKEEDAYTLITLAADKMPVGKYIGKERSFTTQTIQLQKSDTIYLSTDGYADQFGGPQGKKLRIKQMKETLLENAFRPMPEQAEILELNFITWKGDLEQIDDVCVLGVKI